MYTCMFIHVHVWVHVHVFLTVDSTTAFNFKNDFLCEYSSTNLVLISFTQHVFMDLNILYFICVVV